MRVPAEWEPIACVWLSWPHNEQTWPGHFEKVPPFYANWVRRITESIPVKILASQTAATQCERLVGAMPHVNLVDIPTNDAWIRDYGPTFVANRNGGAIHAVDWKYNAWGGKYPPWDLDDAATKQLCQRIKMPRVSGGLCLEGGALEFDGHGRLLTTPACLICDTRNPGWSKETVSQELHRRTGVTEIVWLDGGGLLGDDTDGHIDQLARFIDRRNVVVAVCGDVNDENYLGLEENYRQLRLWGDATTPRVNIHRLPIPPARFLHDQRVPESYCNFLRLGPERLLVPTFDAPTDDQAIGLLRELSGADVEAVDCRNLVWGLGSLHCASREQPAQGS